MPNDGLTKQGTQALRVSVQYLCKFKLVVGTNRIPYHCAHCAYGKEVPVTNLTILLDERGITRALGRFARILDEKRWHDLSDVFAMDLTFDYGSGEQTGIPALERQMRQYLDVCGPTKHLLGSILVDVDGDRARSYAYIQARHQRRDDAAGTVFDSTGEYRDQWERRVDGWRIVRREAVWFLHSGDPAILAAEAAQLD